MHQRTGDLPRCFQSGVAGVCSVVGEFFGLPDGVRDAFSVTFEGRRQVRDVVRVWKVKAACNQDGLDGFLAGLLCIKAQVFEVATGYRDFSSCEIASGPVQPLLGIVGRNVFRGFPKPPCLHSLRI